MAKMIAALCVSATSAYKQIDSVDVFDKARDARTFTGGMPIVAHPPCRAWSAFTSHQALPEPGEIALALECVAWLRKEGGVLEHPAHSRLFAAAGLPKPGQRIGDLFTVAVLQAWWGYPMRKETWLCFSRINVSALSYPCSELPVIDHDSRSGIGDRRREQLMSKAQRAATPLAFAQWLVRAAALAQTMESKP